MKKGHNNSIMSLSNVSEIDSAEFIRLIKETGIDLKTKSEYRKELNYE